MNRTSLFQHSPRLLLLLWISLLSLPLTAQEESHHTPIAERDSLPTHVTVLPDSLEERAAANGREETSTVDLPYYRVEDTSTQESVPALDTTAFSPDPVKAVWYSALCPGLGQIYNRSYWKLPILVGGYLGLIYATNWNARYFNDYSTAYRDAMDNDPNTNSFINFLAYNRRNDPEWIAANMAWLQSAMKRKKDYYRKYRDLCIISMIGVYFVAMIEAYVDAHLYNFDISDNLSMKVAPTVIEPVRYSTASIGFQCAITF